MKIKNWKLKIALPVLILLLGCVAYYIYSGSSSEPEETPFKVPVLNQKYENAKHGFGLTMPEGFTSRESSANGSDTIVFENAKAEGIQIVISPYDDIKILTKAMIESDIPDMQVLDPQPVEIGNANTGLAFRSDNDAFNGKSREVWFVFNRELYQISTYERLDELLQKMFATWTFTAK